MLLCVNLEQRVVAIGYRSFCLRVLCIEWTGIRELYAKSGVWGSLEVLKEE